MAVSVILAVSASCLDCFRPPACFGPPGCFAQIKLFRIQGWLLRPAWLLRLLLRAAWLAASSHACPASRSPIGSCGEWFLWLGHRHFRFEAVAAAGGSFILQRHRPTLQKTTGSCSQAKMFLSTMPNNESQRMRSLWTCTLVPHHASHGVHREKEKVSKIPGGGCWKCLWSTLSGTNQGSFWWRTWRVSATGKTDRFFVASKLHWRSWSTRYGLES